MYGFRSRRQVAYKPRDEDVGFRVKKVRENPQAMGLGLTVHHDTRNKKLLELLNSQGYCISYSRVLMVETALANAVVENTKQFHGIYVPPILKKGKFLFFAVDNTDFAEDTPDGKGTTHGTITAIYQRADTSREPIAPPLHFQDTKANSLSMTPHHTSIMPCEKPKATPNKYTREFTINNFAVSASSRFTQLGWVIVSTLSRIKGGGLSPIPGWAGYHFLLSTCKQLTEVGSLPLLPEVAHEWSTLLTVIMQACQLKELAVGREFVTVISFDMALYEKAVRLLDARRDLRNKVMPRLGELPRSWLR